MNTRLTRTDQLAGCRLDLRNDRTIAAIVGLALAAFYVAIQRGDFVSWDGRVVASSAWNLWEHGSVRQLGVGFPEMHAAPEWSVYGVGISLLLAPVYGLLQSPFDPNGAQFLTLVNPLIVAVTGALLFILGAEIGLARRTAVGVAASHELLT